MWMESYDFGAGPASCSFGHDANVAFGSDAKKEFPTHRVLTQVSQERPDEHQSRKGVSGTYAETVRTT